MELAERYPPRHYGVDGNSGYLGPYRQNQVAPMQMVEETVLLEKAPEPMYSPEPSSSSTCTTIWPYLVCGVLTLLGVAAMTAAIVIPTYIIPVFTPTTTTTTTTSTTTTTTTTTTSTTTTTDVTLHIPKNYWTPCSTTCMNVSTTTPFTLLAQWNFEDDLTDSVGIYHGFMDTAAVYVTGYVNKALVANGSQYADVTTPFLNLTMRSFTVQAWIYAFGTSFGVDYGILGQCESFVPDHCLLFLIRSKRLYMAFFFDDVAGATNVPLNVWTHVAFVYDITTNTKSLYMNGILDGVSTGGTYYQGTLGHTYIGHSVLSLSITAFPGYIDQVSISNRVKTPCELRNDATLVSHFGFDGIETDSGPNKLKGIIPILSLGDMAYVAGVVNLALMFSTHNSMFQACSYSALGQTNQPYTIALWVNPTTPVGTILHLSSDMTGSGSWCLPMLGFSVNGTLIAQSWSGSLMTVVGPQIPAKNWTHVVQTWSTTNGLRLYVNGDVYASTSMGTYTGYNLGNMCILLGQSGFGTNCVAADLDTIPFKGSIDEFYVYNRELTVGEICPLAHP